MGMMHIIVREGWHDLDYIARYAEGFDELLKRLPEFTPERVAELTGISKEDIETLAREYATTRPAVIRVNYGIQRAQNGGAAMRAVCMLPVITGSFKEIGGGLQLSTSGAFQLNRDGTAAPRPDAEEPARPRGAHHQHGGAGQGA